MTANQVFAGRLLSSDRGDGNKQIRSRLTESDNT
jgi:hypothetical protein